MPTYPDGGSARHTDPSTSHAAAMGDFSALEWEVAETVRKYGKHRPMCVVEIWHKLPDHSVDAISPRMTHLVRKGLLIEHPKQPRANRYGKLRKQLVYSYVPNQAIF
jgi:predicted transcriptional regulator